MGERTSASPYTGLTDSTTLQCKSAYMALRRVKGRHMCDAIESILDDIHAEYRIRKTTVRTTTDNGANFVKAFGYKNCDFTVQHYA